jgi:hypothetical protein
MKSITALQLCTDQVAIANLSESTRHYVLGSDWLTSSSSCTSVFGHKTLVFVFNPREGPKLTLNFKVGWQEADRLREGRHASSRQTGLREGRQAERRHKVAVRRQADRRAQGPAE